MSPKFVLMLYVLSLIVASILSSFWIFASGLAGSINFVLFLITGIFGLFWAATYVRQLSFKNKQSKILFSLSGTVIIYNVLLSTLFTDPVEYGWTFVGTPWLMLVVWYFVMYQALLNKVTIHWLVWILFIGILLFYAWDITSFYYTDVIS